MNYLYLLALAIAIGAANIWCGFLRQGYERYSYGWYFYASISFPVIVYLRVKTGFSWDFVPLLACYAIGGQVIAGLLKKEMALGKRRADRFRRGVQ